jgi:predicted enzyme related to lactoylglutathione lyase
MIADVSTVVIGVQDQERAKRFWTKVLGFELVQDAPYGEERWLEVRSPDGRVSVVLELRPTRDGEPRDVPGHVPTSNVMFRCDNILATHRELVERGVDFPQPPVQQPFGWWSMFADSEGNRFALGQAEPSTRPV